MDDLPVFENLPSTKCGLTVNCARDETVVFVKKFTALLATSDAEIDDFVKITYVTNSDRPVNGKILIPTPAIVALEDLGFELKDMSGCGALPVLATRQELDIVQLN